MNLGESGWYCTKILMLLKVPSIPPDWAMFPALLSQLPCRSEVSTVTPLLCYLHHPVHLVFGILSSLWSTLLLLMFVRKDSAVSVMDRLSSPKTEDWQSQACALCGLAVALVSTGGSRVCQTLVLWRPLSHLRTQNSDPSANSTTLDFHKFKVRIYATSFYILSENFN